MSMRWKRVVWLLGMAVAGAGAVLAPRASVAADWSPALQKIIAPPGRKVS